MCLVLHGAFMQEFIVSEHRSLLATSLSKCKEEGEQNDVIYIYRALASVLVRPGTRTAEMRCVVFIHGDTCMSGESWEKNCFEQARCPVFFF